MNRIEELIKELSEKVSPIFANIVNLNENEFQYFHLKYKVDLGFNEVYLSFDEQKKYLFFKTLNDGATNIAILFDSNGEIMENHYENHSMMVGSSEIRMEDGNTRKQSLSFIKPYIIKEFRENSNSITKNIDQICYHFKKEVDKYPIPFRYCHIIPKSQTTLDIHKIRQVELDLRDHFNEKKQYCLACGKYSKLDKSHLISAHNLRSLSSGLNQVFYSARFFYDLQKQPLTSLMNISSNFGNEQNTNFKIACFCKECEKIFIKSDINNFTKINKLTKEILIKTFGIYIQECNFNIELLDCLEKEEFEGKDIVISKIQKERGFFDVNKMKDLFSKFKSKSLKIYKHPMCFDLLGNPFIETYSLSFNYNYFYLIIFTNKDNKLYSSVITNDPCYPKNIDNIYYRMYAVLTINKYVFYEKNFHEDIKNIVKNMIYDYYNNDFNKNVSHPLLFPKINYVNDIKNIVEKLLISNK